ncbi:hypothetical protein APX70_02021 [Pseudomonas syringae pv. maculicola]|uniref:Uncharacterized protein n=1 Tax=Pseudomonas syringae pv. maculicola TaxID=59511 RepID=A0A3M3AZG6_PSEYM|nr:hypothetical protein APX70_02021 [Pseudomonas syringae pv. maculicola]
MHRAQFIAHFGVHHQQAEHASTAFQAVAAHQLLELRIGVMHQQIEVVGLSDLAEFITFSRTDQ